MKIRKVCSQFTVFWFNIYFSFSALKDLKLEREMAKQACDLIVNVSKFWVCCLFALIVLLTPTFLRSIAVVKFISRRSASHSF